MDEFVSNDFYGFRGNDEALVFGTAAVAHRVGDARLTDLQNRHSN